MGHGSHLIMSKPITSPAIGSRGALWLWFLTLALTGLGCVRPAMFIHAVQDQQGGVEAQVHHRGLTRVLMTREQTSPPWQNLLLRNRGTTSIHALKLWGSGGADLFEWCSAVESPPAANQSITLLPAESFVCSDAPASSDQQAELNGMFLWTVAGDDPRMADCISRSRRARLVADKGLLLKPATGEAWVEWTFTAPIPHVGAQLNWQTDPPDAQPQIWLSLDQRSLARLPIPRGGQPWIQPVDLSSMVAGHRRFRLRMAFGSLDPADQRATSPTPIVIKKVQVERQVGAPGHMRPWRPGLNELSIELQSRARPRLEVRLF